MVDIGDVLEIGGEEATVCFTTVYEETPYMCVAFEEPTLRYDIYKYKNEDNKLMVSKLVDDDEIETMIKIFTEEAASEYGIPEEIQKYFNNENDE